ncbi:MAG: zf-HC2 domain-containing protein [Bryobacteraceae bacterium]
MLRCREVSELLSRDELGGAPRWTRLAVKVHLAMCRHCSRFARQLAQIRAAAIGSFAQNEVNAEFESRLVQRLQR